MTGVFAFLIASPFGFPFAGAIPHPFAISPLGRWGFTVNTNEADFFSYIHHVLGVTRDALVENCVQGLRSEVDKEDGRGAQQKFFCLVASGYRRQTAHVTCTPYISERSSEVGGPIRDVPWP